MAIAAVGGLGTVGSATANQATLVHTTTTTTCAIGTYNVVIIAVDNNDTVTGDSTAVASVADSAGNTYTRAKESCISPGGAAQDGADVSIWYGKMVSALAIGGTITATFTNAANADASGMSARNFSVASGSTLAIEGTPTAVATQNGTLDVPTANISCLRVRANAVESNSSVANTATSGWSVYSLARSSSGTSGLQVCVRGEYHISTGTSDPSTPTNGAPSGDAVSVYVAFREVVSGVMVGSAAGTSDAPAVSSAAARAAGQSVGSSTAAAVSSSVEAYRPTPARGTHVLRHYYR